MQKRVQGAVFPWIPKDFTDQDKEKILIHLEKNI